MADLRSRTTRLRRLYRRHRRIAAAGLAGLAVVSALHVIAPPSPPRAPLVVAAHDLLAGSVIGPDDVHVVEIDPALVPTGSGGRVAPLVGRVLAGPMREGEPLTDRRLLGAALLAGYPDGTVASPVRIQDSGVVSLLRVGDRIDIYSANGDQAVPAERIVSDAPVMTLPSIDPVGDAGGLVVLAVPPTDAARLAQASATASLSLSVRG